MGFLQKIKDFFGFEYVTEEGHILEVEKQEPTVEFKKLLFCAYRPWGSDEAFRAGLTYCGITGEHHEPYIIWDKYGRFISDKEVYDNYEVIAIFPEGQEFCLSGTYVENLGILTNIWHVDCPVGLLDNNPLRLKRHESDFKVMLFKTESGAITYGLYTEEFRDYLFDLEGNLHDIHLVHDVMPLDVENLLAVIEGYRVTVQADATLTYADVFLAELQDLICKQSSVYSVNLFHILLLLEGYVSTKVLINLINSDSDEKMKRRGLLNLNNFKLTITAPYSGDFDIGPYLELDKFRQTILNKGEVYFSMEILTDKSDELTDFVEKVKDEEVELVVD